MRPVTDHKAFRRAVLQRDRECAVCGATTNLVADHIRPLVQGGTNDLSNGQALCTDDGRLGGCHGKKTREERRSDFAFDWNAQDAWADLVGELIPDSGSGLDSLPFD